MTQPEFDAAYIVQQLSDMDAGLKERFAGEIAEVLWAAQRSRALTDAKQTVNTRYLHNGVEISQNAAGGTVGLSGGKSQFDIINFNGGLASINSASNARQLDITVGGGGADCLFDLLVSPCWAVEVAAGRRSEGEALSSLTGCTFYVYSTFGPAVTKAATLYTATKSMVTIAVCGGDYSGEGAINWPTVLYTDVGAGNTRPAIKIQGMATEMQYLGQNQPEVLLPGITIVAPALNYVIPHIVTDSVGFYASISATHTSSYSIQASKTQFFGRIRGTLTGVALSDCYLGAGPSNNSILFNGSTGVSEANLISITGCMIAGIIDLRQSDESDPYGSSIIVANNQFRSDAAALYLGAADVISIMGNTFTTTASGHGADLILYDPTGSYTTGHMTIVGNAFEEGPISGAAIIRFNSSTNTQGQVNSLAITGNAFGGNYGSAVAATTAYIKLTGSTFRRFRNVAVVGNTFGEPGNDSGWLESNGGFTVLGTFVERSVFGPNGPAQKASYNITNGANNEFYPATSASGTSTGGDAATTEPYVTIGNSSGLSAERALTAGAGISITDGGANSTVTVAQSARIKHFQISFGTNVGTGYTI